MNKLIMKRHNAWELCLPVRYQIGDQNMSSPISTDGSIHQSEDLFFNPNIHDTTPTLQARLEESSTNTPYRLQSDPMMNHNVHQDGNTSYRLQSDPMMNNAVQDGNITTTTTNSNVNSSSNDLSLINEDDPMTNNTPSVKAASISMGGTMNYYTYHDAEHLRAMFSYGSCAPQSHVESSDRKLPARDLVQFRHNSSRFLQGHNGGAFPSQGLRNLSGSSSAQNNIDSNLSCAATARVNVFGGLYSNYYVTNSQAHLKVPSVASLPSSSTQSITLSAQQHSYSNKQEPSMNTTTSELKPPPTIVAHPQQGDRLSPHLANHRVKKPSKRIKKKVITCSKHKIKRIGPKASSSNDTQDDNTTTTIKNLRRCLQQPYSQMMEEAKTNRKKDSVVVWFRRLDELLDFKDKSGGHTNVPQQYLANRILGIWVNKQRMEKKAKDAGKNSSMTDAKIKLLEEIGFVWAKEKGQAAWEESFRQLQAYHEKHGNCNVPTKNNTKRALGRWVSTQRANYKKFMKTGKTAHVNMDEKEMKKRIRRLNGINFAWSQLPRKIDRCALLGESNTKDDSSNTSSVSSEKMTEDGQNDSNEGGENNQQNNNENDANEFHETAQI